jgi:hypothetical protein
MNKLSSLQTRTFPPIWLTTVPNVFCAALPTPKTDQRQSSPSKGSAVRFMKRRLSTLALTPPRMSNMSDVSPVNRRLQASMKFFDHFNECPYKCPQFSWDHALHNLLGSGRYSSAMPSSPRSPSKTILIVYPDE